MSCIDKLRRHAAEPSSIPTRYLCMAGSSLALLLVLAGCSNSPTSSPTQGSSPATSSTPAPGKGAGPAAPSTGGRSAGGAATSLGPPKTPRSHAELRRQAAQRLVAANPDRIYMGTVPDVLLAIPVLEVELTVDGQIRHIKVLRKPGQALDTVQLAMDAVHRAAPFGNVSGLPKPWVFSETFLFNDQRKFKPRTLDE
ncbi:MAG TPA: hypothetical protein VK195_16860 [Burkholderiaceae bacterium]|nr:hypothetical protein [Burkholderiaceae bacterium]